MGNIKGYMTVKNYADKMGISVQAVYKQIKHEKIKSIKLGSTTLIKL